MKTKIQILSIIQNAGRSKKTGNDYDMRMAQTVAEVVQKDGTILPMVGVLLLPAEHKDTRPGFYLIDFRLSVSQQGRIESVVGTMTPCDSNGKEIAPASAAPVTQKAA
jgi:hypothetical protein